MPEDESYLNKRGLAHFWENIDDLKLDVDGTSYRTTSIPYGACDNTSTSTVFTATVPGITELRDGVCMWLKNGVVTSAAGFTININNLGAKPVYNNMAAASADTTIFNVNYTMFFVYDSTRVAGGCWVLYRGYNSDNNTIGYQVRTNSQSLPMTSVVYRYRLLFTSADNQHYVPANNSTSTNATASRTVCQDKINPLGRIFYYGSTTSIAADARPGTTALWEQYAISLGYSFNRTGAALTLTSWKPVYVKATPQSDGSAIIDSTTPYVQDLPTTEDGKIYIFLGIAYSATNIELQLDHPVYYYKNGTILVWTGAEQIIDDGDVRCFTGDSIVTDNTAGHAVPLHLSQLLGNAEQTTISGINQLPTTEDWTQTLNGVTIKYESGVYTFSGTATASGSATIHNVVAPYTIQAGDYFHYCNSFASPNINIQLLFTDNTSFATSMNAVNRIVAIDTYVGKTITSCRVNFASGSSFNGTASPMILHNVSTQTDYVPFVGGIDSPNPSYPQPVETVTGEQAIAVTGKNLASVELSGTNHGITFTSDGSGLLTMGGTSNAVASFRVANLANYMRLKAGQTCTLSANNPEINSSVALRLAYSNGAILNGSSATMDAVNKTLTFTPTVDGVVSVEARIASGTTLNNFTVRPQLELGSQASDYQPYQKQNYGINLGKNLLKPYTYNTTRNGITFDYTSDGVLTLSGTATSTAFMITTADLPSAQKITLEAGDYCLSAVGRGSLSGITIRIDDADTATNIVSMSDDEESFTVSATVPNAYLQVRVGSGTAITTPLSMRIQLERGNSRTSYASYFDPIELCKIGDYQDYIWSDDGTWKIHKEVGKVVLDGSNDENWTITNQGTSSYFYRFREIDNLGGDDSTSFGACNIASPNAISSSNELQGYCFVATGAHNEIRLRYGTEQAIADWRTFLSSEPLVAYYALATPTDDEITNTALLAQLEAVSSSHLSEGTNSVMLMPSAGAQGEIEVCTSFSQLPVATAQRLGSVIVGNGLNIDERGVLSLPETVRVSIEYGSNFDISPSGSGALITDNSSQETSFYSFVVSPGTYTLYNENTGADITISELYGLLESGKKVVLDNVCIGVRKYDDHGSITIDFTGFSDNIELSSIRNVDYVGDVTTHSTIYSGSAYSYTPVASECAVLGVAVSKEVVVGDESNPTYSLVVDGVRGHSK